MARLRSDPALTATTGQEVLSRTAAAIRRAENRLTELFHPPLPPPCLAEPMPRQAAESGAPPLYYPPARDGSRPGAYLVNCSAFDIRDFHSPVHDHGTLPLRVLTQVVRAWITSARPA